ncbi:MAG: membrane protein insertase YidC [Thermodesulfovibrionia bacterium]
MERRTLLAIMLSILVIVIWSYLFTPKPVPKKAGPTEETIVQKMPIPEKKIEMPEMAIEGPPDGEDVMVETGLYRAIFSTKGGVIRHWELKKYRDKAGAPVILLDTPHNTPPLGILFEGEGRDIPQRLIYGVNTNRLTLTDDREIGELVFTAHYQGISIKKRFIFYNNLYKVDLSIETINTPSYLLPIGTNLGIFDKKESGHKGPVILIESDRKEFDEKLKEEMYFTGNIKWIAQEDKYFASAIVPLGKVEGASVWKVGDIPDIALKLKSERNDFVLYIGPKEYDSLKRLNLGLEHIIDFGWFSIVAMPLFWVLKLFYSFLGNYGWAIILLTIIVRIPFIPLMHKSQQSMKKMQALQPMMAEIKERYKKDPQRMQKELTELYKRHKVNPVGGCLPMLLQIPVFIALYNVLSNAIELRGAPFILWIRDLSARDPYYILPIVMGISMVIQQKMTPSSMDPTQAKMMMLMPIVFTFLFLTFPSGLVLYWLVNNILAIIQQYYANKTLST